MQPLLHGSQWLGRFEKIFDEFLLEKQEGDLENPSLCDRLDLAYIDQFQENQANNPATAKKKPPFRKKMLNNETLMSTVVNNNRSEKILTLDKEDRSPLKISKDTTNADPCKNILETKPEDSKVDEDLLQQLEMHREIDEILTKLEKPSCCARLISKQCVLWNRICCKYTPRIYFKKPLSWYSATSALDAGTLLRENYLGIVAGILIGFVSFPFFSVAFAHLPHMAALAAGYMMMFTVFGIAFSSDFRCILLITLPYLIASRTRWLLMLIATTLATTGPAINFMHNSGNFRNAIACVLGQVNANVELIGKITKAPLMIIVKQLGGFIDNINSRLHAARLALRKLKEVIYMATKILDQKSDWIRGMVEACGDEIAMKNQCLAFFNTLYFNCAASMKSMSFLCNLVRMFADQACNGVAKLNDICVRESNRLHSEVTSVAPVSEQQLEDSEASILRFLGQENISIEMEEEMADINFGMNVSSQAVVTTMIEERMDLMMNGLNYFKRAMAWLLTSWTLFTVIQLIVQAAMYRKKWLKKPFFDNGHITSQFLAQVGLNIFVFFDHERLSLFQKTLEQDISNQMSDLGIGPSEQVVPDIQGNSTMSEIGRSFLNLANPLKDIAFSVDATICRPRPSEPDHETTILIGLALVLTILSIIVQVYVLRLRHLILAWYYPDGANRRAAWLRTYIKNTRGLFHVLIRKLRNRKLKKSNADSSDGRLKRLDRFIFMHPKLVRYFAMVGVKRIFCAQCSAPGNPKKKFEFNQNFTQCPRCGAHYCRLCQVDLSGTCLYCNVPLYNLSAEVDFENWSSDEEYDYFYVKYFSRKKHDEFLVPLNLLSVEETLPPGGFRQVRRPIKFILKRRLHAANKPRQPTKSLKFIHWRRARRIDKAVVVGQPTKVPIPCKKASPWFKPKRWPLRQIEWKYDDEVEEREQRYLPRLRDTAIQTPFVRLSALDCGSSSAWEDDIQLTSFFRFDASPETSFEAIGDVGTIVPMNDSTFSSAKLTTLRDARQLGITSDNFEQYQGEEIDLAKNLRSEQKYDNLPPFSSTIEAIIQTHPSSISLISTESQLANLPSSGNTGSGPFHANVTDIELFKAEFLSLPTSQEEWKRSLGDSCSACPFNEDRMVSTPSDLGPLSSFNDSSSVETQHQRDDFALNSPSCEGFCIKLEHPKPHNGTISSPGGFSLSGLTSSSLNSSSQGRIENLDKPSHLKTSGLAPTTSSPETALNAPMNDFLSDDSKEPSECQTVIANKPLKNKMCFVRQKNPGKKKWNRSKPTCDVNLTAVSKRGSNFPSMHPPSRMPSNITSEISCESPLVLNKPRRRLSGGYIYAHKDSKKHPSQPSMLTSEQGGQIVKSAHRSQSTCSSPELSDSAGSLSGKDHFETPIDTLTELSCLPHGIFLPQRGESNTPDLSTVSYPKTRSTEVKKTSSISANNLFDLPDGTKTALSGFRKPYLTPHLSQGVKKPTSNAHFTSNEKVGLVSKPSKEKSIKGDVKDDVTLPTSPKGREKPTRKQINVESELNPCPFVNNDYTKSSFSSKVVKKMIAKQTKALHHSFRKSKELPIGRSTLKGNLLHWRGSFQDSDLTENQMTSNISTLSPMFDHEAEDLSSLTHSLQITKPNSSRLRSFKSLKHTSDFMELSMNLQQATYETSDTGILSFGRNNCNSLTSIQMECLKFVPMPLTGVAESVSRRLGVIEYIADATNNHSSPSLCLSHTSGSASPKLSNQEKGKGHASTGFSTPDLSSPVCKSREYKCSMIDNGR
ncbi:unnamed protein product [Hydatigera taeniaeformis]|uniref:DC_STAMP domain-containing protein n=1 Tax=Hydatigena taeniaeformis TaxID=6205 RepID=A0A0R3WJU8_HYDTA|nr:unnamed protein product [Hydatigera taeniaeformis]